jgi:hypothetical protein
VFRHIPPCQQQYASVQGAAPNEASCRVAAGLFFLEGQVSVSTPGLIAIGGVVTSILLSTAAIVWVFTRSQRAGSASSLPKGAVPTWDPEYEVPAWQDFLPTPILPNAMQ